jgi:hypothetical protein
VAARENAPLIHLLQFDKKAFNQCRTSVSFRGRFTFSLRERESDKEKRAKEGTFGKSRPLLGISPPANCDGKAIGNTELP